MIRHSFWNRIVAAIVLVCCPLQHCQAAPPTEAADSFIDFKDDRVDAQDCLNHYRWKPTSFSVRSRETLAGSMHDRVVTFASPRPCGDTSIDQVEMEWYFAREGKRVLPTAPAIVVVHESGRGMTVGRLLAQLLSRKGFHTFLVYLPTYGTRTVADSPTVGDKSALKTNFLELVAQGVSDVRRARDAVAIFPEVESTRVGVLGVSLGGFVATNASALDDAFSHSFILLAGGDIEGVILRGAKDAAKVRQRLNRDGLSDKDISRLAQEIEPLRIAHRMDASQTWLFSAIYDQVVPLEHGLKLAQAIQLEKDHHLKMPANHYSGVVMLPLVIEKISVEMAKPLSPKPLSPKPLSPKPLSPKPLSPKPLSPKPLSPKPLSPTVYGSTAKASSITVAR
jgi:dienelactone hydrolase